LKGRKSTAYPAVGPDVTNAGAEFVSIPVDQAMTEGNLVSAPAWPAHPAWMSQFIKLMGAKIEL
jgi:protease I